MTKKPKRQWTDEQRAAAAERMRKVSSERWSKIKQEPVPSTDDGKTVEVLEVPERVRPPEVQAVIDTMEPSRRAKLAAIQARNLAVLGQTPDGREALKRLDERHHSSESQVQSVAVLETPTEIVNIPIVPVVPPTPKLVGVPFKTPFRLSGNLSGQMISELGDCVCGARKLQWHPICLKVKAHV